VFADQSRGRADDTQGGVVDGHRDAEFYTERGNKMLGGADREFKFREDGLHSFKPHPGGVARVAACCPNLGEGERVVFELTGIKNNRAEEADITFARTICPLKEFFYKIGTFAEDRIGEVEEGCRAE